MATRSPSGCTKAVGNPYPDCFGILAKSLVRQKGSQKNSFAPAQVGKTTEKRNPQARITDQTIRSIRMSPICYPISPCPRNFPQYPRSGMGLTHSGPALELG